MATEATTTKFAAGERIFGEGDAAERVFIINGGHVRITRKVFNEEIVVETLGRGNICGDIAFAQGAHYPVSAYAADEVELVVVERDNLESVMLGNPTVVARLASRLAARLTHAHFRMANFALRTTLGRVMLQLRWETERDGGLGGDSFTAIPYDLPEAIGAEKGNVDRALRGLVADSLIELDGGGRYRIPDIAAFDRRLSYLELRDRFEE